MSDTHAFPHLLVPCAVQLNVHVAAPPLAHATLPPFGGVGHVAHAPPQRSVPLGHPHLPLVHWPTGHWPHAAPAVPEPQLAVVSEATGTHVLPLQHPAHVVEHSAAHAPPRQIW